MIVMLFNQPTCSLPFRQWLFTENENKRLLRLAVGIVLVQFVFFRLLFPFPNITDEGYLAIEMAQKNWSVGYLPIGYPMFLRLISSFTSSDLVLVLLQYILLQISILYLLFSIKYIFEIGKWLIRIVIGASVLNPLLFFVSNLVTRDSLLASLMFIWFTQLLWLMYKVHFSSLLWHSALLLLLFMVDHDTWYCVPISFLVFFFLPLRRRIILCLLVSIVILFGAFIGVTQVEFKRRSGETQFSAYWGWQRAANALYAYAHADTFDRKKIYGEFYQLHGLVNDHLAGLKVLPAFVRPDKNPNAYYLTREGTPLKMFMQEKWAKADSINSFKKWSSMGPLYAQYGNFLINNYPGLYWRFYILPNLRNYYVPETEALSSYNRNKDTMAKEAVAWFHKDSNKITPVFKNQMRWITYYATMVVAVINLLFILSFLSVWLIGGFSKINLFARKMLLLLLLTWIFNLAVRVWTSPVVLRQQLFILQIALTFSLVFTWILVRMSINNSAHKNIQEPTFFHPNPS